MVGGGGGGGGGGDRSSSSSSFRMLQATPPSPPSDHGGDNNDNPVAVFEVDFFSDRHQKMTTNSVNIKNEEASNITIGLQLLTANTGSDQSTMDDGVSSDMEDKRGKSNTTELAQVQAELQKMNLESQKFREMFSQFASNQLALQMQLLTLMQQQQQQQNQIVEGGKLSDDKKPESMVPRQFVDLGPSAATVEIDHEVSNNISSSEERTQPGTPPNKTEIASLDQENSSFRNGKRINREESQGRPNKAQKLNNSIAPTKSIDQSSAEATMRKARVSVRALSEAPTVFGQTLYNQSKFSGLQLSQDNMGPISHQLGGQQFTPPPPPPSLHPPQSSSFADTVGAATAAITADPNFTAALAAAISSITGSANNPVTAYPISSITGSANYPVTADPNFTAALAAAICSITGSANNPFNSNSNSNSNNDTKTIIKIGSSQETRDRS